LAKNDKYKHLAYYNYRPDTSDFNVVGEEKRYGFQGWISVSDYNNEVSSPTI
jgi:hypothetical protein